MPKLKYSLLSLSIMVGFANAQETGSKPTQKDEQEIETLVITATPLNRSILESATPVSIIAGEDLKHRIAPTLGETLKNVPGVHSTYFGPVSSSPIIRGLNGPRVKIVQNGLDVSDASRVGPDHAVSTEASNATQIEVLRGPATLLYGSGAIGGVINVVDNRLPRVARDGVEGEVSYLHDTVSSEDTFNLNLDGGTGKFAWHFDAFDRETEDYEIPGFAEIEPDEGEQSGVLENSFIDANGYTAGFGYVEDDFSAAVSYGKLKSEYGIAGHSHDHEDEDHDDEDHDDEEHDEEHAEEELVFARLNQDRYQALLDWSNLSGFLTEFHLHTAYTEYTHSEIEDGEIGTTFNNDSFETRLWSKHKAVNGWEGVIGLNYVNSDFSALGEEAFTPASETDSYAFFVLEEKRIDSILWQVGARAESTTIRPDNGFFEEDHDDHDEEEHDDDHDEEHAEFLDFNDHTYTTFSFSTGLVWTVQEDTSLALNFARSERAPSASELFSNGAHIGTSTFEVGAAFDVIAEGDEYEIVQRLDKVKKETSNNIDLTYRYLANHLEVSASVFYNDIGNYLFEQNTGFFFEDEHDHLDDDDEHEDDHDDEHDEHEEEGELPIFLFKQQDAELYGFEIELDWHINDNLRLDTYADYTRAKLSNGDNVPRIPPLRIGAELHWESDSWHAELGVVNYSEQDNITEYETTTDGYTLVNAAFNYYMQLDNADFVFFVKGNNLTDEEARVHSSFLKDEAPLPGRSLVFGTRVTF